MNILYIGTFVENECGYYSNCSIAGNKFQENMLKSLSEKNNVDILSYIEYPLFPNGKKILINEQANIKNLSYIKYVNLPVIKEITIKFNTLKYLRNKKNKYDYILAYNLFPPYLEAIIKMKSKINIKIGSIIADLYIDNYVYESYIKRFVKKRRLRKEKKIINKLDFCIPITDKICKYMGFRGENIVIEGGIEYKKIFNRYIKNKNETKIITYTGSIDSVNGIEILIDLAERLKDNNIEINILGDGPLKNLVIEKSEKINNINYIGKVSNEESIEYQLKSDLLILIRPINQEILKYTFPSKLHEYLLTEIPIISTNIPGIGEEYFDYLNIVNDNSEDIYNEIEKIFKEYGNAKKKAKKGKEFVINNKTWDKQICKINEFLSELLKKEQ